MRDLINKLTESIDSKDSQSFVSFLTDDCTFTFGNAEPAIGKEAIFNAVEGFFNSIDSLSHTIEDYCECNDRIIYYGTVTYKRHNGSYLSVKYCNYFKLRENLIAQYNIFIDISQLYN